MWVSAVAFLEAVNRAKSAGGASVGRHVARLRVAAGPRTADLFARCQADVLAAARVLEHGVERREGMEEGTFEVADIVRRIAKRRRRNRSRAPVVALEPLVQRDIEVLLQQIGQAETLVAEQSGGQHGIEYIDHTGVKVTTQIEQVALGRVQDLLDPGVEQQRA